MANRQEIWDIFYSVPFLTALPEYLQRIANEGKGGDAGQTKSSQSTGEVMKRAKEQAMEILAVLGVPWNQADPEDLQLERLSGGFTNLVFKCALPGVEPIVLKVEFPKPQVDKEREYEIARIMAVNGLGPRLLATYPEGRIEEYLDIRIATEEEMQEPKFAYELGKKIAAIHSISIEEKDDEYPATVTIADLENEVDKIEKYLKEYFSCPIHLIHNDIFLSNVLVAKKAGNNPTADDITLIDYEFSLRTHRAMEAGFCRDFTVNPFTPAADTAHEKDLAYCRGYLEQIYQSHKGRLGEVKLTGDMESDIKLLLEEMDAIWPVVVFFWGLWHIVCAVEDNNLLDYETMFQDKMAAYYALKNILNMN